MNRKTLIALISIIIIVIGVGLYFYLNNTAIVVTATNNTSITYKNTDYGFTFSLPLNWQGYSIIQNTWNGNPLTNAVVQTGPKLIIRNPNWTVIAPYEDIPILIFTISQWDSYTAEDFSVSAAPIQASELGRNNTYVFALPPRWNYDYSLGYKEAENIIKNKPLHTFTIDNKISLECHNSPKYFAIQKSIPDSVGSDILIKYKTSINENLPCAYILASDDFEIKNVSAEYFLTFTDNFLLLDKGTAPPPRDLVVYDLRSRKIIFTDSYMKPVVVAGDSIAYLSKTDQKPTLQNCPNLNEYTSNSLGAVIMSKITVDLLSLNKKYLGVNECVATQ